MTDVTHKPPSKIKTGLTLDLVSFSLRYKSVQNHTHTHTHQTHAHSSQDGTAAPGRGGPAQPAQLLLPVRGVPQAVEPLQGPAAQHDRPPVTERFEAPATVVAAEAAAPWQKGKEAKNQRCETLNLNRTCQTVQANRMWVGFQPTSDFFF